MRNRLVPKLMTLTFI